MKRNTIIATVVLLLASGVAWTAQTYTAYNEVWLLPTTANTYSFVVKDGATSSSNIMLQLTKAGVLSVNGQATIGDGGDTVAINSSDWDISTTGVMTGIGAITADGLITGTLGLTITGAAVSLNASSNYAVNVCTGSSTGAITMGGGSGTFAVASTGIDISTAGAISNATSIACTSITDTGSIDVDGACNLGDTTAGSDVAIGNATGNITMLSDNADLTCTDGSDNAFQVIIASGDTVIDLDTGATNQLNIGGANTKFSLASDTIDISNAGAITGATGLSTSGAISCTGTIDVDGGANLSDTTAGADVAIGNSTGNITMLSDNADLTLTDGGDNAYQIIIASGDTIFDVDLGATNQVNLGGANTKFSLASDTIDISNAGAITGAASLSASGTIQGGTITDGAFSATSGAVSGVTTFASSGDMDLSATGGTTGDPDLSVAGYAKLAGASTEITGELVASGEIILGDGSDPFSVASTGIDISTAGAISNATSIGCSSVTSTGAVQTGANGSDGSLVIYSEQGGTDYQISIAPHATMTGSVVLVGPAALPSGAAFWKCDASGNWTFDETTYLSAESDTLDSVTGRGATTANAITTGAMTSGANGADGKLTLYSEQGGTDFSVGLNPNASMTSAAEFYLPADEPGAESFLKMGTDGVIDFDTNTYLTANQSITLTGEASGSGTTSITVALAESVAMSVPTQSGTATPASNAVTINGGGIAASSATGSTVTITATEAQDLDAVLTIGGTSDVAMTLTAAAPQITVGKNGASGATVGTIRFNDGQNPGASTDVYAASGGAITVGGDFTFTGHNNGKARLYNDMGDAGAGDWTAAGQAMTLAQNKSGKVMFIRLDDLVVGEEIVGYTLVGAIGATTGATTEVDCALYKDTSGAGAITSVVVADSSITQVDSNVDVALAAAKTLGSPEVVATDTFYWLLVVGGTTDNAACDITICGAEVIINSK